MSYKRLIPPLFTVVDSRSGPRHESLRTVVMYRIRPLPQLLYRLVGERRLRDRSNRLARQNESGRPMITLDLHREVAQNMS